MTPSAITLFCEDIRDEKSGMESLVGVLPATLNVAAFPWMLPKLGIYCRVQFPTSIREFNAELFLRTPWKQDIPTGSISKEVVSEAKRASFERKLSIAAIVAKGILSPLNMITPGIFEHIMKIDQDYTVCGAVIFQSTPPATPS